MQKPKESEVLAVYRPSLLNQAMAFVTLVPVILLLVAIINRVIQFPNVEHAEDFWGLLMLIALLGLLTRTNFPTLIRNRLIVRFDGLEWWYGWQHDFALWDELKEFNRRDDLWRKRTAWGIYTIDDNFIPVDHFVLLPISTFPYVHDGQKLQYFRETEAGELIEHYAPHLFKDLEKQKHS